MTSVTVNAMLLLSLVAAFFRLTNAQTMITVMVGDTGSFFDPQVVVARPGDVINFQWTGMFHSITQSSFANPCTPLPNGFDSGVTGNPTGTLIIPEWNLTVTDDTQPIWFFCKVTKPVPHCTNGMVGAINAPLTTGNQTFNQFVLNAKTLTNPPTLPTSPPVLSGVGAFATITPVPQHPLNSTANATSSSTSSSTSSFISSSSSSIPAPIQTQMSSGLSSGTIGGIVGGIVGGLAVIILLVLLAMSYRRGRRFRKEAIMAKRNLHSQSSRDMSQFSQRPDILYRGAQHSAPHIASPTGQYHRPQGEPSVADSLEGDSTSGPTINIKELAAEIARNIREEVNTQGRQTQNTGGLGAIPEQLVGNAVSRVDSARGVESVGRAESARSEGTTVTDSTRGRQLPRPPPSSFGNKRAEDTRSVDTLPAYVVGQSR